MDFAASILAAFEAGRAAWPGVMLSIEQFAEHTTRLAVGDRALGERSADLFLACACGEGDPLALRCLEAQYLSQVHMYLAHFSLSRAAVDDVRQTLRVKLLVGSSTASPGTAGMPGILGYRGNGSLSAWLRVTAVRTAIDTLRRGEARANAELELADLVLVGEDTPELATVRNLYRERVRSALEESFRSLDPRQKTLLRLSLVDGLNIDGISAIYRVHRATVARWFAAIRAQIVTSVRTELDLPGQPSPSEVRSLIGVFRDDIHLSARRILTSDP